MNLKRLFSFTGIILLVLAGALGNGAPTTASYQPAASTTLTVSTIDGTGSLHNTFPWTIEKLVTPDTWDLFRGDMATSAYTIKVTKGAAVLEGSISGQVCVMNGAASTENLTIELGVTQGDPPYNQPVTSGTVDTSGFPIIEANASHCYEYRVSFPSPNPSNGKYYVTAKANATNATAEATKTSAGITLPTTGATDFHTAITVKDDYANGSWHFSDSGSANYKRQFTCDQDAGAQKNTATITFDDDPLTKGSSASATVTVNCFPLKVEKSATASGSLKYDWSVDKKGDETQLTLAAGETFPVHYWITPTAMVSGTDVMVSGLITVTNPAPIAAKEVLKITDVLEGQSIDLSCPYTNLPGTLAAGEMIKCSYSATLSGSTIENTATATLQNYSYDENKTPTTIDATTDFTGTATISGASDDCITLTDTFPEGPQGQEVCGEDLPEVITYTHNISTSMSQTITNTVSFVTNDTHTTGSASWAVQVNVPSTGCTLSFGYWKTHSKYGPAPYDTGWEALPGGEDATFFLSGLSYYKTLWTPPKQGNAYFILAHQYIAVVLNKLNGADTSTVDATLDHATDLFETYTPDQVLPKKPQDVRQDFIHTAAGLERFNGGYAAVTDCSEFTYNLYSIPVPLNAYLLFLPVTQK